MDTNNSSGGLLMYAELQAQMFASGYEPLETFKHASNFNIPNKHLNSVWCSLAWLDYARQRKRKYFGFSSFGLEKLHGYSL